MPPVFERLFRVRFYECDGYGHVNHAHYLRYMQETAFDASAAVGYDMAAYDVLGTHWLVRQSALRYLRPLEYGDTVAVRTWVADFRRATSRRRYEMHSVSSGELVAEGYSDWVYLTQETVRPARVPPKMVAAFSGDGLPEPEKREPFPAFPPPPPGAFQLRHRVRWSEIDFAGHVNNAAYLVYFEDAAMALMTDGGWPAGRLEAQGIGIVARHYRIEYLMPALLGDELEVTTWVSNVRRTSVRRHYTLTRLADQQLICRAEAHWVWVDLRTGRPVRIPADFLAAFAANVAA